MFIQIFREAQLSNPANMLKFVYACLVGFRTILRDKTILTLPLPFPLRIIKDGVYHSVSEYYEIPFYTYDYSAITDPIPQDALLVDIGGHFGEVTYRFLKNGGKKSLIFEPNPYNISIIQKLLIKEGIKNYTLFPVGLGNEEKEIGLHLVNPLSYEGSLVENTKWNIVPVKVVRFDSLNIPDFENFSTLFFKIDVAGFEIEVFKGMKKSLQKWSDEGKTCLFMIEIMQEDRLLSVQKILQEVRPNLIVQQVTPYDYLFSWK